MSEAKEIEDLANAALEASGESTVERCEFAAKEMMDVLERQVAS